MNDWLDDLSVFPASVVSLAVTEWRRHNSKRPTPADIRGLCVATTTPLRAAASNPPRIAPRDAPEPPIDDQFLGRVQKWNEAAKARDEWARECGYKDFAEGLANGLTKTALYPWQVAKKNPQ